MGKIVSVAALLSYPLHIPQYQRPYKWTRRNVYELLSDIDMAISEGNHYKDNFKYRVGSVILHKTESAGRVVYEIVDGQQRLITLSLIRYAIDGQLPAWLEKQVFADCESKKHIYDNNLFIREWFSIKFSANKEIGKNYLDAYNDILQAVVLEVQQLSEAFQLFDSQNARGRELDPHDLLKAYHLREMNNYPFEKLEIIRSWEKIPPGQIRELFSLYLFPILNWSRQQKSKSFTSLDIDNYKGVTCDCGYTYAQRVHKAMPCFQINEPFSAGSDFFAMVEHYNNLLNNIKNEIAANDSFKEIRNIIEQYTRRKKDAKREESFSSTGFRYAVNLFYCAIMFYYDRFHLLDIMAVRKLFIWAMMTRVDRQNLGFDTINNYAIGTGNESYTNNIPMFFKIATARNSNEIANIRVEVKREHDKAEAPAWQELYQALKHILGVK